MENQLDNTLLVFSSDNESNKSEAVNEDSDMLVPLFLYWKGKISPFVSDALVCQIDLMASLSKLVNACLPDGLDSHDYLDAFMGKTLKAREHINYIQ